MTQNNRVGGAVKSVLGGILNPVSIVVLIGPVIMNVNLILLMAAIDGERRSALFNNEVLALVDYRTQFFTAIVAIVFYYSDNIRRYWKLLADSGVKLDDAWTVIQSSNWRLLNFAFVAPSVLVAFIVLISGMLATPEILDAYIRPDITINAVGIPPLESPLTWIRGIVFTAGYVSTVAFSD